MHIASKFDRHINKLTFPLTRPRVISFTMRFPRYVQRHVMKTNVGARQRCSKKSNLDNRDGTVISFSSHKLYPDVGVSPLSLGPYRRKGQEKYPYRE
jgi:hypothetical protein